MVAQALEWLAPNKDDVVLDLFSGVGNFTLPLALKSKQVFAVEGVNNMVLRLQKNAELNQIDNISAHQADLSKLALKYKPKWLKPIDKLLLDPARDGAFDVVQKIPLLAPKKILYVSCNPSTMVRDIKELQQSGYKLSKLGLLNMFPHTAHIEAMALLEK
jgi:23S rRNA (uracil1939-C5)-methyltransferase